MSFTFSEMQQSSFFIVLTSDKESFNGRLSCTYDRMLRLNGHWEVALVQFNKTDSAAYVLCDLVDYSHVNNNKVQLLSYFSGNQSHPPSYIKLMHKRFSTINIDIKKTINGDSVPQFTEDITCVLHFKRSKFI